MYAMGCPGRVCCFTVDGGAGAGTRTAAIGPSGPASGGALASASGGASTSKAGAGAGPGPASLAGVAARAAGASAVGGDEWADESEALEGEGALGGERPEGASGRRHCLLTGHLDLQDFSEALGLEGAAVVAWGLAFWRGALYATVDRQYDVSRGGKGRAGKGGRAQRGGSSATW